MNALFKSCGGAARRQLYIAGLAIALLATTARAAGPALECKGVKANSPDMGYALTLSARNGNSVVVIDTSTSEKCSCKFKLSNFFDQSNGMVPGYVIFLAYQSCDYKCPQGLKKQIKANIKVDHRTIRAMSYATPFVGDEISNCDVFSMDLPMLKRIGAGN